MPVAAEVAIERTINIMWNRHAEPLSLEELAEEAIFSKFYYSRVFRDITGTSPGRFLSAIRLFMAKRHLLETASSVTDISYRVGYNSLGTFTSRFTRSVGISPAKYRFLARCGMPQLTLPAACTDQKTSTVTGRIHIPETAGPVRVYVAAFNTPIVEGLPQSCDILEDSGPFHLTVPDGLWFVRAAAVAPHEDEDPGPKIRMPRLIGSGWPVKVRGGRVYTSDVQLRAVTPFDLPILLALPELDGPRAVDEDAPLAVAK
ncbi:helix-turn-helix transcriptional regulator [Actinacidiphila acididurans]|uniref:Helix-turn-helix transcriptional regulator n=1 Tax=Actinacidiphila acididurans TaxID=2784346 RepID=A0ABS2TZ60_9ACTN|nr:helix-turn-helix transcriptional regulator [Actinacidiphila acididurans]MBM9508609.1 helix-turn-helix transcriptional regulator [Actinacidiphila acididurans]